MIIYLSIFFSSPAVSRSKKRPSNIIEVDYDSDQSTPDCVSDKNDQYFGILYPIHGLVFFICDNLQIITS